MFANTKAFSGFAVDDLSKARGFYGETLGLKTSGTRSCTRSRTIRPRTTRS
jgi:extradiol dioxygenase family protein